MEAACQPINEAMNPPMKTCPYSEEFIELLTASWVQKQYRRWIDRGSPEGEIAGLECESALPRPENGLPCRHLQEMQSGSVQQEISELRPESKPACACKLRIQVFTKLKGRRPNGGEQWLHCFCPYHELPDD